MDKKELREKFGMLIDLDNDEQLKREILKLGQEKYEILGEVRNFHTSRLEYYTVYDKNTINFMVSFRGDTDIVLTTGFEELFMDNKEWKKLVEEKFEKEKYKEKRKEQKETEILKRKEKEEYLRLKEKYEKEKR